MCVCLPVVVDKVGDVCETSINVLPLCVPMQWGQHSVSERVLSSVRSAAPDDPHSRGKGHSSGEFMLLNTTS